MAIANAHVDPDATGEQHLVAACRYCASRLATISEILSHGYTEPQKVKDALLLADVLLCDQLSLALTLAGRPAESFHSPQAAAEGLACIDGSPAAGVLSAATECLAAANAAPDTVTRFRAAIHAEVALRRVQRRLNWQRRANRLVRIVRSLHSEFERRLDQSVGRPVVREALPAVSTHRITADDVYSRLATVTQLLNWEIDGPSRCHDALLIAEALLTDLAELAFATEGDSCRSASLMEIRVHTEGLQDATLAKTFQTAISSLEKPWRTWKPEQQARLGAHVLSTIEMLVEQLLPSDPNQSLSTPFMSKPSRVRPDLRMIGTCLLVAFLGCAAWLGTRYLSAPRLYHERMGDLKTVTGALVRYRDAHGEYPVSQQSGREWNGIGWHGTPADWIPGLAPAYLPTLPVDPRGTQNPYQQYVYRSDGRDYKLLVLMPDDCEYVVKTHPAMDDLGRNTLVTRRKTFRRCTAYGYWTADASTW